MAEPSKTTNIVILGGGFAGAFTAVGLQKQWRKDPTVHITLVSRSNYFLMTPLLFEAGSGILEPRHAVNPLRPMLDKARFIEAQVTRIDLERKSVLVTPHNGEAYEIPYDHLVLALGGVTNTKLIPGSEHALTFKTLGDAIFLRNYIIQLFEEADVEEAPERKAAQLTFVLIGGGLVSVELCGELTEFLKNLERSYPRVSFKDVRIEMVEGGAFIAAEFDEDLRQYIADVLRARGVNIRLNTRAKLIEPGRVHLSDGAIIDAQSIILGTGVVPSAVVSALPIEKDKKGRAVTEPTMRCKGRQDLWALGDCAAIPDPSGKPYPELAQHAIREARVLAKNITAAIRGQPLENFVYQSRGTMAALGHFKGVGKVMGFRIKGFFAWWVWRTYYLMQMQGWSRRIRVVLDWTTALFFKNDIVQLDLFGQSHPLLQTSITKLPLRKADAASSYLADASSSQSGQEIRVHQPDGNGQG